MNTHGLRTTGAWQERLNVTTHRVDIKWIQRLKNKPNQIFLSV